MLPRHELLKIIFSIFIVSLCACDDKSEKIITNKSKEVYLMTQSLYKLPEKENVISENYKPKIDNVINNDAKDFIFPRIENLIQD